MERLGGSWAAASEVVVGWDGIPTYSLLELKKASGESAVRTIASIAFQR